MKHVLMTGGHAATTAMAVMEEFLNKKEYQISWVGAKYAVEGKKSLSLEFKLFSEMSIDCYPIFTGRIQKKFSRYSLLSAFKIPLGFLHALYLIILLKPDVILSFGGYAAFPVVFVGWALQIPVIIHEQTAALGLSNKWSNFFAFKIAVSRQSSMIYFNKNKTILTGNPVMKNILKVNAKQNYSRQRVVYITGGSRGSQILNEAVSESLTNLLKQYHVIHQTGQFDYSYFEKKKKILTKELKKKYEVFDNINPLSVGKIYEKADVVVARAGANTVSEIILTGRPSVLIPIPWSRFDEQNLNAKFASDSGIAEILEQDDLSGKALINKLELVFRNWKKMNNRNQISSTSFLDKEASKKIFNLVCEALKEQEL